MSRAMAGASRRSDGMEIAAIRGRRDRDPEPGDPIGDPERASRSTRPRRAEGLAWESLTPSDEHEKRPIMTMRKSILVASILSALALPLVSGCSGDGGAT